jgi:REP element-mobilizing transposase RayT
MQDNRPTARPSPASYRRNLPHLQRPGGVYHITFSTRHRIALPEHVRGEIIRHCLHDHERRYWLHAAVVMPDHVHLLLAPLKDARGATFTLAEIMRALKGSSARTVNRILERSGALWQDESFDHILRSDEGVRATAEYICENPVTAGLVTDSDDYPWLWRDWIEGSAERRDRA